MTEEQRIEIVKIINDKKQENYLLKERIKELNNRKNELLKNTLVQEYINLIEEIKMCDNLKIDDDSLEKIISEIFWDATHERKKCSHDIWIYSGSICEYYYELTSSYHYSDCYSEKSENFCCNEYDCLTCGERIYESDYEEFEEKNLVLKDYGNLKFSSNYYRKLYYRLLYDNDIKTAKEKVIDEFYKDLEKSEQRKRVNK